MENLNETYNSTNSSTNSSNIEEESNDDNVCIGVPPWVGKNKIDKLRELMFHTLEKNVNELNGILKFLAKQSVYTDVKLFLIEHDFLFIAHSYLLENQPSLSTIYYVLCITVNLCYINKVINRMGKFERFIKTILSYFQRCKNENILRKILKLLRLATYEIQTNSESVWIVRFKECKFFERRIIFLLEFSQWRTAVRVMLLIRSISEINLPNQINILEQLFDIDTLTYALLKSYVIIMPAINELPNRTILNEFVHKRDFNYIGSWLNFLIQREILVDELYITNDNFNTVLSNIGFDDEIYTHILNITHEKFEAIDLLELEIIIKILCKIVKMLLKFCYVPKVYGKSIDYLNSILLKIFYILNEGKLHLRVEPCLETLKKLLSLHWLSIVAHRTCQHVAFILKSLTSSDAKNNEIVEYLINYIRLDCNVTPEMYKKMEEVIIIFNEISN